MSEIYSVINQKVIDYAEIIVILFEHCNLRCAMCPQNHETFENTEKEKILSKVDYVSDWINNHQKSKYFKIHIMGGEVFEDIFVEKGYLDIYQEFIDRVNSNIIDKDKEVVHNFVTNLVFTNTQPVLEFLDKNDLKVSTSYDSTGRFSPRDLEIFKQNIELFKDKISMVACVMTAPTMKAVIKGDDYFDYLYQNFLIDWDSLWPTKGTKVDRTLMPKESETYEFYKTLVDRYPKCLNVEHFVTDKPSMKMTCTRGNNTTILQDNSVPKGCSGAAYLKDGKTEDLASDKILINFFEKYNCFECEFFQRCPFTCFIKADYKYIEEDLDECVFKKTFRYAREKQSG